jgi:hypothetical protein
MRWAESGEGTLGGRKPHNGGLRTKFGQTPAARAFLVVQIAFFVGTKKSPPTRPRYIALEINSFLSPSRRWRHVSPAAIQPHIKNMDVLDSSPLNTPEPEKTMFQRATTAGLLMAAAGIVLGLIIYVAGLNKEAMTNSALKWGQNLLLLGTTFYFIHTALQQRRQRDLGGYLSVGQGIGLGTLAGLVSGLVSAVWMYFFMTFIATDMGDMIKEVTMQQMQERGLSEEQAEEQMRMAAPFMSPVAMGIMVTIFSVFFGFLCGLISGLILRKEKPYR